MSTVSTTIIMADSTPLNLVQITSNEEPWVINQRIFDILNTSSTQRHTLANDCSTRD